MLHKPWASGMYIEDRHIESLDCFEDKNTRKHAADLRADFQDRGEVSEDKWRQTEFDTIGNGRQ